MGRNTFLFDADLFVVMAENNNSEKPIVIPQELLKCEGINLSEHKFEKALLAFMPIRGIKDRFNGQLPSKPIFTHMKNYWVRGDEILIGPIYGSPFCAIILEELSVFGVKYAIGCGFSGALDENIGLGSIMIAESGFCSDGTSQEYTQDSKVYADMEMLKSLKNVSQSHGVRPKMGKVWTTDALYRELPSKIAYWKKKGAKFVNLETSAFYAVAKAKGIKAVYLSVVSDNVSSEKWSGWSGDLGKAVEKMWAISLEVLEKCTKLPLRENYERNY